MVDLTQEYFHRDLTEAEEQALSDLLLSSDEAADRFIGKAEATFVRYGLPDPVSPGTLALLKPWAIGVAVLAGLGLWWNLRDTRPAPSALPVPQQAPSVNKAVPAVRNAMPPLGTGSAEPKSPEPPPSVDAPPETYTLLKVVVEQDVPGPVVVRVVDRGGEEVRRMYQGTLQAGQWAFRWDGKLTDGNPAKPGTYIIEIDNGKNVQTRKVEIQ